MSFLTGRTSLTTVNSGDIADDAVTLAKMAAGTANYNILYDGSGNPAEIASISVAQGGTGASTHTANNVLVGAGTSAITSVAPSTSGNVLTSNGSAWTSASASGGPTSGTKIDTTSGTSHTFTGIPAGVTRIFMAWEGVSSNGGNHFYVRLGDSGGIETSGYVQRSNVNGTYEADTVGFRFSGSTAAGTFDGNMTFILVDASTFTCTGSGLIGNVGYGWLHSIGGSKSLSAVLTQIQFMNLTNTFDAGKLNIVYD